MKIITNNVPRYTIDPAYLTADERERFDYLDWPALDDGLDSATFVRYRGELYDLGEFIRRAPGPGDMEGWDGVAADSFFSATLVKDRR